MPSASDYKAIVMGASIGGMEVVSDLVSGLPEHFGIPLLIVQHIPDHSDGAWPHMLNERSRVRVKEADEKEVIQAGSVYLAPANYHLLLESDGSLSLTIDERVNFARPSIDVLFETAAESLKEQLIGLVCTGGNHDGAQGLRHVKKRGGLTIVQDPQTSKGTSMPLAAIEATEPDHILSPSDILKHLIYIHQHQS